MEDIEKTDARVYELAYLFVPTIDEAAILGRFGDLKALIEKEGGTFVSEDMPKMIELAYEMSRVITNKKTYFTNAYFGWIKFELDPSKVEALKPVLDRNEEIIRYMILKTVRENTIASKKPIGQGMYKKRVSDKKEPGVSETPLSVEEIDKEIDAMIEEKIEEKADVEVVKEA